MKFLVIGAGRMGYAVAFDLIRSPRVEQVIIADNNLKRLTAVADSLADAKVTPVKLDVEKPDEVEELMSRCDVAIGCVSYQHNYDLTKAALKARTHFCDLGGNEGVVSRQVSLDEVAREAGVTIMPDLGLAPGLVSILSMAGAEAMDELYEIRIRVGGVPVEPECFLGYTQTFSIEGLINEYIEEASIIRDGKDYQIPSLSELEEIEFPKPFGTMEAFATSGGISTLPQTYLGRVQHLDCKTIRWPGHCNQIRMLKELGLMSSEPVKIKNSKIVPRQLLQHLLSEKLPKEEPDVVILRITVTGLKDKSPNQIVWECIDYNDQASNLTAMMRMTAFPASIIAQMIARQDISEKGVLRQEKAIPVKLFLNELASRGIVLTLTEREPVPA